LPHGEISCKISRVIRTTRRKSKSKASKKKALPPYRCRKIQGLMHEKALTLEDVAGLTGINYYRVCRLLRFQAVDREALDSIEDAVRNAPMPQEEAHV